MARTLRTYFESAAQQRAALKELGEWFDPAELDLYDASCLANDAWSGEARKIRFFPENLLGAFQFALECISALRRCEVLAAGTGVANN